MPSMWSRPALFALKVGELKMKLWPRVGLRPAQPLTGAPTEGTKTVSVLGRLESVSGYTKGDHTRGFIQVWDLMVEVIPYLFFIFD